MGRHLRAYPIQTMEERSITAAQIATALGSSKQAAHKALRLLPSSIVDPAKQTRAWRPDDLPDDYRKRLQRLAKQHGYKDASAFIENPRVDWRPEVEWHELQ